jgi:acyl carrier protein
MKRTVKKQVRKAVERLRERGVRPGPAAPAIERWLTERIARELAVRQDDIRIDVPIERYGLDSRVVAAIAGDLEDWLERPLEATLLWDYPTIREVSAHLAARVERPGSAAAS